MDSPKVLLTYDEELEYPDESSNFSVKLNVYNLNQGIESGYFQSLKDQDGKLIDMYFVQKSPGQYEINFYYSASKPVPMYAKAACPSSNNLSYTLEPFNSEEVINPPVVNSLLEWKYTDINDGSENDIKDIKIFEGGADIYSRQAIDFNETYNSLIPNINDQNYMKLRNILYVPSVDTIANYKLNLANNPNAEGSYIYTVNALSGSKTPALGSTVNDRVLTIEDIFSLISSEKEKACIYTGVNSTHINWIEEKIDFTQDQLSQINQGMYADVNCE